MRSRPRIKARAMPRMIGCDPTQNARQTASRARAGAALIAQVCKVFHSRVPRSHHWRGRVGAVVVALAGWLWTAPVVASEPPQPRVHAETTTVVRADQVRGGDRRVVTTRAFASRLALTAVARDAPVIGRVRFDYDFDAGLPSNPDHPLLAERQLEPGLAEAWVRTQTRDGAWTLTAGRHVVSSASGLVSIDGMSASATLEAGLRARVAFGQRVEFEALGMNGWASDDEADLGRRTSWRRGATVTDASLGWSEPMAAAEVTVRDEQRHVDEIVVRRAVGAGARIGPSTGWHGTAHARHGIVFGLLEHAEATLTGPVGTSTRLGLSTRLTRPTLPLDSFFAVFAMTPRRTESLTATVVDATGHRWDASAHHAVVSLREDRLPVTDTVDRRRAGGRLAWTSAPNHDHRQMRTDVSGEHGDRSTRVDVRFGLSRRFRRGPRLTGDLAAVWRRDERAAIGTPLAGAYVVGTLHAPASRLATMTVRATAGGDTSNRARLALLAMLDLRLPRGIR